MNYQRIYVELIDNAKSKLRSRKDETHYESHHILPRSFGGADSSENRVFLTLREHFLAHLLLYKIVMHNPKLAGKMFSALRRMSSSKRYRVTSRQYENIRTKWIVSHQCKLPETKEKIKTSLRLFRLQNGWYQNFCGCGCGTEMSLSKLPAKTKIIKGHSRLCECGCGEHLLPKNKKYLAGHRIFQKIKCACGCGGDTYKRENAKNKDLVIYINGHNSNKNAAQRESIQRYLQGLSKEELTARMKRSTGKSDNAVRIANIRRGKGSKLRISYGDGTSQDFWSYDDIKSLTGFTYDQIKYRIKRHNGVLQNSNVVCFLSRYSPHPKIYDKSLE